MRKMEDVIVTPMFLPNDITLGKYGPSHTYTDGGHSSAEGFDVFVGTDSPDIGIEMYLPGSFWYRGYSVS